MAASERESRGAPVRVALRVRDALAADEARALSQEELGWLSPRATPRRREEFVAGRVAVKRAVAALTGVAATAVQIARAGPERFVGAPFVLEPPGCGVHVSISHAAGWVVAAADRGQVGVDLVAVDEALDEAFAREWFTPEERAAWGSRCAAEGGATDAAIARRAAFAGKEAALKWLGVGLTVPAASVACVPEARAGGAATIAIAGGAVHRVALALELGREYLCALVSTPAS